MFVIVLLSLCFILILIFFKTKNNDFWKKQNVVQVNGLVWDFVFGDTSLAEVYKEIYDKCPTEPYVGLFIGTIPVLLVRDLDNIQAVLAGDFQSFHSRGITLNPNDILGDNVIFIDDYNRWKILRQKLTPVFTSAKLKNMFYIMDRCAQDFVKRIEENPKTVEMPFDALYTYTTASIAACTFGIDTQTENTMDSPFLVMAKKAITPTIKGNFIFTIAAAYPRLLTLFNLKAFSEHEDFFIGVLKNVLEIRRNSKDKRHDFVDICLELQEQGLMKDTTTGYELEPTVELLAAQAFFLFIAGADTSATTMSFTLMELSYNPDILKKVHDEIDKVFVSCSEKFTYNELEKLQYLDMVLNESLRKYPPMGLIQRRCMRDTTLPVGGVKIKKDCMITVPAYALHRDEKYYPNPEKFDPERFSSENIGRIPKFAYLPFGEGNRICLGMRFARLQIKAGLAWFLRRYTVREQSPKPIKFERSVFALRVPNAEYDLVPRNKT